tara:strand:+ start:937 stop:2502 length:1566 start_codon:yes stop_codon:yes gene_type:complete
MQNLQQSINLVLDYVKGIWIKKRYVMFCSWLICPIGFFYVASMPDQYQSRAVVFVDTRSVLQPILRGLAIQTNPAQEIQMMVKTLLSRSNVEKIARESDLDLYTQDEDEFDQLVSRLTKDIRMGGTGRDNIYTISYSNAKPLVAQRVVQETLDLFVEGALGGNRRENDTAGRFLDEQIADYERRLAEAESELADFKRRYSNVLPLQGTFYSRLQSLNEELRTTKLQIRQLTQQAETLQGKLVKAKSLDGFGVNNGNDSVLQTRYDERIRSLEEELDRLRLRFTDQHPDVIETKMLLEGLEEARDKEIEAFLAEDANGEPVGDLNRQLNMEISRVEGELAAMSVKETDLASQIEELESKIDLVPQIEAEASSLNRDYDITRKQYEQLLSRREAADLSRRADSSAEELQFRTIEPPSNPQKPSGPNRIIFYTGILVVGFGVGIGLAFILSQLSPVLVRPKQLLNITNYPIWGTVSHFDLDRIKRQSRMRLFVFLISSGVIVMIYAGLVGAEIMNIKILELVSL